MPPSTWGACGSGSPTRGSRPGWTRRVPPPLPERARCVIVGGGAAGASIAYHLAKLGWRDVVLVDRAQLTSGSTFHSARLVGQLRGSVSLTRMMVDSVGRYRALHRGWAERRRLRLPPPPRRREGAPPPARA